MFDGTTVTMPDTSENQQAYPQVYNQKPGLGFPIARIGAITSLSCGAIISLGFSRYAGKVEGEVSLLRRLWDVLRTGDVLLALYQQLLDAVATHQVADRPDRFEPRVKKHLRNHYGWLTKPRAEVKRMMAKGFT